MRDYPKKFSGSLGKRKNVPLFETGGPVNYYKGGRVPPPDEPEFKGSRAMPEPPPPDEPEYAGSRAMPEQPVEPPEAEPSVLDEFEDE